MRLAFLIFAALLVQACGGASRDRLEAEFREAQEEAAAESQPEDTGPDPVDAALDILRDCALEDVGRLLALLDVFGPLLDPTQPFPAFELSHLDRELLAIHWRLDTTGDGVTDVNGSFRFEDADGEPTLPFSEEELEQIETSGSLASLPALLEDVPPGTVLQLQFNQGGAADVVGSLGIVLGAGSPMLAGTINIIATTCTTGFRIRGIDAAGLAGDYPDADIPITVAGAAGVLIGSVLMDGSPLATIRVTYEDTPLEFLLDLDSGTLVEVE